MRLFRVAVAAILIVPIILVGCGKSPTFVTKDEPWRADAERACLGEYNLTKSPFVTPRTGLGGPSACGAIRPFDVSGTASGRMRLKPAATLQCAMIPAVDRWLETQVSPAARRYLAADVVEIKVAASYSCRPMNGIAGGKLSEHGHANALDVSAFYLSDGRVVSVKDGWNGGPAERAFLRDAHRAACENFTTVLGPLADSFHHDHFHMDLARHGRDGSVRICK